MEALYRLDLAIPQRAPTPPTRASGRAACLSAGCGPIAPPQAGRPWLRFAGKAAGLFALGACPWTVILVAWQIL